MTRLAQLALAATLLAASPAGAATVAEQVFGAGLMSDVRQPMVLHYRYQMHGKGIEPAIESPIAMDVREIKDDGNMQVFLDMFAGADRRQLGPISAHEQNPLVLVLLQRDVAQMAKLTGGAAGYFQQQIRRSFSDPAESTSVDVVLGDQKLNGTRLVIHPFRTDPQIANFPQFKEKAYEFVVADGVPGGLYQLVSRVPDAKDGHLILEESVTFEKAGP